MISGFITLLAIPVLPLELGFGKVPLGQLVTGLAVLLAVIYTRNNRQPLDRLELAVVALATWAAFRSLLLAPILGEPISWWLAFRDVGLYAAAIGVYRLAQEDRLRAAVVRGLTGAFTVLVGLAIYQEISGLARLRTIGYTAAQDFHYYTEAGGFRPFGLFAGPTTYATFVAMVGVFLTLSARSRTMAFVFGITTFLAVAATETRAAILSLAVVAAFLVLVSPRIRRSTVLWASVMTVAIMVVVLRPATLVSSWERLLAATVATDDSRVSRFAIWNGVVQAASDRGEALVGMADANWVQTMGPQIGTLAYKLGHAHSNFFESWYKYGLVGALLFTVIIVTALSTSIQKFRSNRAFALGSLGSLLVFTIDSLFNNSLSSANFVLMLFLTLGMSGRAGANADESVLPSVRNSRQGNRRERHSANSV